MSHYYRPIAQTDPLRPATALPLAGGWTWFDRVEVLDRGEKPRLIAASDVPGDVLDRMTEPRPPLAGMFWGRPHVMGILNVTPDSFSDGGRFLDKDRAVGHAQAMVRAGADIIDIGGESTRPGAQKVPAEEELRRTEPVIRALREGGVDAPISIDSRKSAVVSAALKAGASMVNDVAALTHDPALARVVAESGAPVCLMHAQGDPATMQDSPEYDDVLLDVYDFLAGRLDFAEEHGIPRGRIIVDPGIGFGKTTEHNLRLLSGLSLFHGLGCVLLLGASRKRFIGTLSGEAEASRRVAGSVSVALHGARQGVQILRVHDIPETKQSLALQMAIAG